MFKKKPSKTEIAAAALVGALGAATPAMAESPQHMDAQNPTKLERVVQSAAPGLAKIQLED